MMDAESTIPVLDESAEAPPVPVTFCRQVTSDEYKRQKTLTTNQAVRDLLWYLESEPEVFKKMLKKRKHDDLENAGLFSCLKVKLLSMIQGNNYQDITDEEFVEKFAELKSGMMMALNSETEMDCRRYSKRLAAKRLEKENLNDIKVSVSICPSVPQPVVAPTVQAGPVLTRPPLRASSTPVGSENITMKPAMKFKRTKQDLDDSFNEKTMASIHRELLRSNPQFRHRTAFHRGSPGRTPFSHKKGSRKHETSNATVNTLNLSTMSIEESLHQAFNNIIQKKFTKSPSPTSSPSSAAGFQASGDDSNSVIEWEV
ncbi:uncharacterized protein LOC135483757 [Lineus longissimus]|uniref:uncharacterized protein LOC135483757 n=1 Tax=Lineus longissimus TaxID=88925 RepID=UPI00315CD900